MLEAWSFYPRYDTWGPTQPSNAHPSTAGGSWIKFSSAAEAHWTFVLRLQSSCGWKGRCGMGLGQTPQSCQHPSPAVCQTAAKFRENLRLHLMSHVNDKMWVLWLSSAITARSQENAMCLLFLTQLAFYLKNHQRRRKQRWEMSPYKQRIGRER